MCHGKWLVATAGVVAAVQGALCGQAADYRGMPAGWPHYPAPAASLPVAAGYRPGDVVQAARPVPWPSGGTAYVVPVAYAMPARSVAAQGGYGYGYAAPVASYRPAAIVAYLPVASGSAPGNAYVSGTYGTPARYASYAVTPAGLSSAGSEAAAYYGQPTPLNYVPPQFVYRTTYAAVPVYLYRPVTVYDPATAQPTTCLQPSTTTQCQPQRHRWFSWLHPATWFGGGGCGATGFQPPAATTTYCASGACQPAASACTGASCAQPYYPAQPAPPAIPAVPAPGPTVAPPATTIPAIPRGTIIPPAGTTIPPPPTRVPSGASGASPADLPPRLAPGTTITPAPGGTFTPQPGSGTPLPSTTPPATGQPPSTAPGGSFPTTPSTTPPSGFGSGFGSGAFSPPPATAPRSSDAALGGVWHPPTTTGTVSGRTVGGIGPLESAADGSTGRPASSDPGVIRAPALGPALPEGVRTLPDLDAPRAPQPLRTTPQLIDPRDKTALLRSDARWAVVPARWPTRTVPAGNSPAAAQTASERPVQPMALHQPGKCTPDSAAAAPRPSTATAVMPSILPAATDAYDDRGWRPAAGL